MPFPRVEMQQDPERCGALPNCVPRSNLHSINRTLCAKPPKRLAAKLRNSRAWSRPNVEQGHG
jgi:hypothetical protein